MGSICLLSDGGLPSVSCVTHYSFVRSFYLRLQRAALQTTAPRFDHGLLRLLGGERGRD